jgi:hypothetical protein
MSSLAWCSVLLDPSGSKATKTVSTAEIHQGLSTHDLAVLTVRGEDPSVPEFTTGTPCHIRYGWNPHQVEDFYGYVSHITPPYERTEYNDSNYYMDLVCLGASFIYKDGLQNVWPNEQISSIFTRLAVAGMFSALVETGDPLWPQLSCAGDSIWSFMRECASKLGWILACNRTNFRFMSVDKSLFKNQAAMPTFWSRKSAPTPDFESITNFKSLQGEVLPIDGHIRAIRGASSVDMRTGQIFAVHNNSSTIDSSAIGKTSVVPFFNKYEKSLPVLDQISTQFRLDAEAQRNRFHIQAKATVSGDTSVVQGIPILLLGLGSLNSGVWFVEEVTHRFSFGVYSLDLQLGRDSSGDGGQRASHPPHISWHQGDPLSMQTSTIPPTVLVNNQWRAAWQLNQVVGL